MPHTQTYTISIGPISLPKGVSVLVDNAQNGQAVVTIAAETTKQKDSEALLEGAFAALMTAASVEGVGQPVFQTAPLSPALPVQTGVTP